MRRDVCRRDKIKKKVHQIPKSSAENFENPCSKDSIVRFYDKKCFFNSDFPIGTRLITNDQQHLQWIAIDCTCDSLYRTRKDISKIKRYCQKALLQ